MKKKFIILFVISAFFILGAAQTAQASVVGNPPLRMGSTGNDVVQLQTYTGTLRKSMFEYRWKYRTHKRQATVLHFGG